MNYLEWSNEYEQTALELEKVLNRLKKERGKACRADDKELNERISHYRTCRNECLLVAHHLKARHRGVA